METKVLFPKSGGGQRGTSWGSSMLENKGTVSEPSLQTTLRATTNHNSTISYHAISQSKSIE
jgi:hypothetical protein